ncbi:MAG: hypothetical protein RR523_10425 [Cetobacterium sp.]
MTQAIIKDYLVINQVRIIDVYETSLKIRKCLEGLRILKEKLIRHYS